MGGGGGEVTGNTKFVSFRVVFLLVGSCTTL